MYKMCLENDFNDRYLLIGINYIDEEDNKLC